jgi:hypothetical protein
MSRRVSIFGASFVTPPLWEPETVAYMTAVGIPADGSASIYGVTNLAVWQAWDAFFVTLKGAGLLSKHYYIRGMTGAVANAANYKFNAINPLDTNAAYRAVYFGGVTFTDKGTQGNGTNGYANSFFNDQTAGVDRTDFGITMYSRTASVGTGTDMGAARSAPSLGINWLWMRRTAGSDMGAAYDDSNFGFAASFVPNSQGPFTVNRHPSELNTQRLYRYGVNVGTRSGFAPTSLVNYDMLEMARGVDNVPSTFSSRQYSYFAAHRGMTIAETATYHTAIQTLQTALNRQV